MVQCECSHQKMAGVLGRVQTDMRVLGPYLNVELGMKREVLNRIRAAKMHGGKANGQDMV